MIRVDKDKVRLLAEDIFLEISGLGRPGEKYEKRRAAAFDIKKRIEAGINPQVDAVFIDDVAVKNGRAVINGVEFICRGFEQIVPGSVTGAYVYAINAGDFSLPEESTVNQLYADLWGTAYTDAMRMVLKEKLEAKHKLSDSFGPGFYGMDVSETAGIGEIADFSSLGLEMKSNGLLLPLKACSGILFTVNDKYIPLNAACADCKGSRRSCVYCQFDGGDGDV